MQTRVPGGWRAAAVAVLAVVTAVVVGLTVTGRMPGDGAAERSQAPSSVGPSAQAAPVVLEPIGDEAPLPDAAGLAAALQPLLAQPALGPRVGVAVVDLASGRLVYGRSAEAASTPASTAKLFTAAAALDVLGADHQLVTRVVTGAAAGQIVLVGGGDPTLTTRRTTGPFRPATTAELARRTAAALTAQGTTRVTLGYDASLFAPPTASPQWPPAYVETGIVAPVTALAVDEGRTGPETEGTGPRSSDPPLAAARAFARALAAEGITVTGSPTRAKAPAALSSQSSAGPAVVPPGTLLGAVSSPPLTELVAHLLATSDNDLAEALAHHVALAAGRPADFAGGAEAVTAAVKDLGLSVVGLTLYDGSGLAPATRASPELVAEVLVRAAGADRPELRPVLTGLSVAGFDGTLEDRFTGPATSRAAGLVRAKTGTLRSVGTLAGSVQDADGRVLGFAFLADRVPAGAALEARAALDRMAAALAACGCRTPAASASPTPSG